MTACFIDSDLEHGNFLNTGISQGSVVTQLRCGGIVNEDFVANVLVNLPVKECLKSVNIGEIMGKIIVACYGRPMEWSRRYIFSSCGFFLFLSIFLFPSPNLSGRTLDVCHTSTHGVALVRI